MKTGHGDPNNYVLGGPDESYQDLTTGNFWHHIGGESSIGWVQTPTTGGGSSAITSNNYTASGAGSTSVPATGSYIGALTLNTGAFSHNFFLPAPIDPSLAFLRVILPTSTGQVVTIRSGSAVGTVLATFTTDGSGVDGYAVLTGTVAGWTKLASGYDS